MLHLFPSRRAEIPRACGVVAQSKPPGRSRRAISLSIACGSRTCSTTSLAITTSKWLLEFGEPIRTDAYDEAEAEDPMLVFNVTDQVRETIQHTLYSLLMQRRSDFF